ncbi:methyltransferase domain-containing protein [Lacinutrix cladophorae]
MNFTPLKTKNKVLYLTEELSSFSNIYIAVREKENRILTDNEVAILPYLNRYEWPLREKSTERFIQYISLKKKPLNILDLGCGNGWFSHKIACINASNNILGLDVNKEELEQASRIFKKDNLQFAYGDIFTISKSYKTSFDVITLNGCIQYFQDFNLLLQALVQLLKPNGEIHIIDSPFYKKEELVVAKKRTIQYYTQLGFPEMASHYFHHEIDKLDRFTILYQKKTNVLNKILGKKDSPFSWYRYSKSKHEQ